MSHWAFSLPVIGQNPIIINVIGWLSWVRYNIAYNIYYLMHPNECMTTLSGPGLM